VTAVIRQANLDRDTEERLAVETPKIDVQFPCTVKQPMVACALSLHSSALLVLDELPPLVIPWFNVSVVCLQRVALGNTKEVSQRRADVRITAASLSC
jgi:hypothetical protein